MFLIGSTYKIYENVGTFPKSIGMNILCNPIIFRLKTIRFGKQSLLRSHAEEESRFDKL